jgi:hypothetical protein
VKCERDDHPTLPIAHRQRLGAAFVRRDLADLIAQMEGSPNHQQIAAWLAQLTDKGSPRSTGKAEDDPYYDLSVILHDIEVLKRLRKLEKRIGR